jgi:hypothetical protein
LALVGQIVWDARDMKNSGKSLDPLALFTGILALFTGVLAFGTIALAVLAYYQWCTLENSDQTLKETLDATKASQRAFVYVRTLPNSWLGTELAGTTIKRRYTVELENSGNTQTKNLVVSLYCPHPRPEVKEDPITANGNPLVRSRLLGPKQTVWAGVCEYPTEELEDVRDNKTDMFIAMIARYDDIFNKPHVTEYCVKIVNLNGDFKNAGETPKNNLAACEKHMCADDECAKPPSRS